MLKGIGARWQNVVQLTIAADANDYNMHTAAGSPSAATMCVVTVSPGVTVGSSASPRAFRTGPFAAGSSLKLINRGRIWGGGGSGGAGGGSPGVGSHTDPTAGSDGSDAIFLDFSLTIDNSAGYIFGGGGGGGGDTAKFVVSSLGGGGGGGGTGRPNGAGGAGGGGLNRNGTAGGGGNAERGFAGGGGASGDFSTEAATAALGPPERRGTYGGAGGPARWAARSR